MAGTSREASAPQQPEQCDPQPSNLRLAYLCNALLLVAAAAILLRFVSVAHQYPYYFAWDMDLTVTQDCLLIHSRLLPDLIVHPGTGMYLLLHPSLEAARALGVVSVLSLDELAQSLNPLSGAAELTSYIRTHSPLLAMGAVLLLWGALVIVFRPAPVWRVLLLVTLGTQASFLFHAALVRSSLYAVFFWSAAMCLAALAAMSGRPRPRTVWLLLAGVAMGLSVMAKIQAVFYVAAVPLVYLLARSEPEDDTQDTGAARSSSGAPRAVCASSLGLAVAVALLLFAAYRTPVPQGVSRWNSAFGVTPQGAALLVGALALAAGQLVLARRKATEGYAFQVSAVLTAMLLGFVVSFALVFLVFRDPAQSFRYLCLTVKMLFLRQMHDAAADYGAGPLGVAKLFVLNAPVPFVVHGLCIALLLFRGLRSPRLRRAFWAPALSALAGLAVVLGARAILRDLIWVETLLNFLSLTYLLLVLRDLDRPSRMRWLWPVSAMVVALALSNVVANAGMPARIDANYNNYGWQDDPWLTNVYRHNQTRYGDIMAARYATGRDVAKRQATRHREIRRAVRYVFQNQRVTHRNIGTVAEGFPVWTEALEWRISAFPEPLREAIVVDNGAVALRRRFLFRSDKVQGTSEDINKVKRVDRANHLAVLGRADLRILLFVHEEDAPGLAGDKLVPCDDRITVSNGEETATLVAFEAFSYVEVPVGVLERPFFTVVQFRDPKLYFPYDVNTMSE